MKAIAVFTGKPNTAHLTEVPKPTLDQIPNGRGVLVKVLRVGVDGTDKEINAAEYGTAPHVIRGHIVGANQVVNAIAWPTDCCHKLSTRLEFSDCGTDCLNPAKTFVSNDQVIVSMSLRKTSTAFPSQNPRNHLRRRPVRRRMCPNRALVLDGLS